jgi:hypothetical protein
MIDRSTLFRSAWHSARRIAVARAIGIGAAFAIALRAAWKSFKAMAAHAAEMTSATAAIVAQLAAASASRPAHRQTPCQHTNSHPFGGM